MIPLVSILIPLYNSEKYIAETLDSILKQTYSNWECIVVDDHSFDNSTAIVEKYCEKYPNKIRLYTNPRKGACAARNVAFEKSTGDYIQYMDADDLLLNECLQQKINCAIKHSEVDFIVFPTGTFYKSLGDSSNIWNPQKSKNMTAFLRHNLPWHTMSPLWKTVFIREKLNGYDEMFPRLQDVEFHTRALLESNVKYLIIKNVKPQCFYRIDENRTNKSYFQRLQIMSEGIMMYIEKFERIIQDKSITKNLRGTLFSFMTQTNYYKVQSRINQQEYKLIIKKISNFMENSDLFSLNRIKFLWIYNFMYQKGWWHIKGFNFVAKCIFIFVSL